jgi:enamine deaminase RidA (YjgF/YER057c/UK114 family)
MKTGFHPRRSPPRAAIIPRRSCTAGWCTWRAAAHRPGEPERQLTAFEDQARRVMDNVAAILAEAGSGSTSS